MVIVDGTATRLSDKIEIADKWIARGYAVAIVLRIVGVNEATYYYHRKQSDKERDYNGGRPIPGFSLTRRGHSVSDEQIKEWLLELVAGEGFAYGYRKLGVCLRRQYKLIINKKKTCRLCKELDILRPQRRIHIKHPRKLAKDIRVLLKCVESLRKLTLMAVRLHQMNYGRITVKQNGNAYFYETSPMTKGGISFNALKENLASHRITKVSANLGTES